MIALFALLALVAGGGLIAAWLGENPGNITMVWFGYQVETSAALLLLLVLLAAFAFNMAYQFLRGLLLAPRHYAQRRTVRHYRLALQEVTHSVAALAANDVASAIRHTKRAEKSLGTTPLTLLLRAQISKNEGSDEQTRQLLEQLLEHPETEYLAAKSLSDAAQKQHRPLQALTFAERAHRVNPRETHGAWALFYLHLDAAHFQEAESHARHARKTGAFTRDDLRKALGKIALKQAFEAHAAGNQHALGLAKKAVEALDGECEAAELLVQLYMEQQQPKKALRVIQSQWRMQPSAKLAAVFLEIVANEKPSRKEKLIRALITSNGAAPENLLLS